MIASSAEPQWAPRPLLALAVRAAQYGLPLVTGTLATWLLAPILVGVLPYAVAWLVSLSIAVAVSLVVSRLTMRLAPLALLLRMTMIFPDHAPSRLKVARRSTGADEISRRLVSERTEEHEAAVTMLALVTALGKHDRHTRGHSERVRLFCDLLARELGLNEGDAGRLRWAALIHDIGKLEVSAAVLNKSRRLDRDEWAQVRMHPEAGARLAQPLREWLGPWFAGIPEHHERFDGSGYPLGLAGEQISLAGRAVAVVDAFETMTAARSYKAAVTAVAARAELTRCAGTHFDPAMVRAFLAIALPRLLWSVGPLAFVINVPFLRLIGDGGVRLAQVAGSTASGAVNAAGVTAVVVATGAMPTAAATASVSAPSSAALQRVQIKTAAQSPTAGTVRRAVEVPRSRGTAAPTTAPTAGTPAPRARPTTTTPVRGSGSSHARPASAPRVIAPAPARPTAVPPTTEQKPKPKPTQTRRHGEDEDSEDGSSGRGRESRGASGKGSSKGSDKRSSKGSEKRSDKAKGVTAAG